ncbi:group 1 glycosyl transferase [Mycolicibacterium madagascariense]|uniref:Group 1 glycosyl transferase n=1 Tax=Mycolicibacterium madagascariense TaxID=212765 RepID=A0A7I7XBE5_9MYCO|nr:glycosyltransferase family 1 protein [Mycolicibacterium madagascariense]MCV7011362.1 glycosyltransferase family 4 protein [Mycolicibacterium madagascariense]BBZ26742.1 group 1 glycosyl transferase [Mycolicibacterium madagascariense]
MTKSVRQVHINGRWLGQPFTGVQRYSEEVASRLVESEEFDFVLHVPKGASVPAWAASNGVRVQHAPVTGVVYEQLYLPLATLGKFMLSFGGIPPVFKRRQVVTFHDATPFRFSRTFRFLFVAYYFIGFLILSRTAYRIMTVSEFSRDELAEVLRVSTSRFLVVPCSSDLAQKTVSQRPEMTSQDPTYLVVGTLARHKNLEAPIEALAASGRHVTVVGASGLASVFAGAAASFGPSVTVTKGLTDGELRWLYENAQALVFPSFYEGFGLPVLEAQTLGCPVITSDAASIPEVAGDGALYFNPSDLDELLRQVELLEHTPGERVRLVEQGRINAERFDWQKSADLVVELLRGVRC